jgi:hypothetical protein
VIISKGMNAREREKKRGSKKELRQYSINTAHTTCGLEYLIHTLLSYANSRPPCPALNHAQSFGSQVYLLYSTRVRCIPERKRLVVVKKKRRKGGGIKKAKKQQDMERDYFIGRYIRRGINA